MRRCKMKKDTFSCTLRPSGITCLIIAVLIMATFIPIRVFAQERTVKVGACFDITGTYQEVKMPEAYTHYFNWINEKGGLKDVKGNPVKLELVWRDCASKVPEGLIAYKSFLREGCVVMFFSSTPQNMALAKQANEDKIPLVSIVVSNPALEPNAYIYGQVLSREASSAIVKGIKEIWNWKGRGRPPKIGFLNWNNVIGMDWVPYAKKYASVLGMEVGPDEYFTVDALDVSSQLRRLHEAKCDYVITVVPGGQNTVLHKSLYDLGFKEDMKLVGHPPEYGSAWSVVKKLDPKITNGNIIAVPWCTFDEKTPANELIRSMQKKYRGVVDEDMWGAYEWGFHPAMVTVEGIRLALQKVPFENLTGEAVKNGLDAIKDFDTGGLSAGASYADFQGDKCAAKGIKLQVIENGKLKPLTGWISWEYLPTYAPKCPDWVKEVEKEKALKK